MVTTFDTSALVKTAEEAARKGYWELAKPALLQLLALDYEPALTAQALGNVCMNEGLNTEAIRWFRQALALNPKLYSSNDNLIFLTDAQPDTTERDARLERIDWWNRFGQEPYSRRQPHRNVPDPHKRLRVGYVSGDFCFHSAAFAFTSVITSHNLDVIEPVLYSTALPEHYDDASLHFWKARYPHAFVDVSGLSAQGFAQEVRNAEIDILVDLSGYTRNNRLVSFCEKPAPIQIQAWGYVLGCACPAIDVIFADPIVANEGVTRWLCERVVNLPALLTYFPRPGVAEPNPLPCLTKPPIFAVFQRAMKGNPETWETWRQILERVPDARIVFKGPDYSPTVRTRIVEAMASVRNRIEFVFHEPHFEHMQSYSEVDLALDPWPQTGGVSTMEALWMGVPCVTLLGERMIQRASASFLTILGFEECITHTREDYVNKAVALVTTERERLAAMRATARPTMAASPIMVGYTQAVEDAYRQLWIEWCQRTAAKDAA